MKALHWGLIGAALGSLSLSMRDKMKGNNNSESVKHPRNRAYKENGVIVNSDGSTDTPL